MSTDSRQSEEKRLNKAAVAIVLLSLIGLVISAELLRIHMTVGSDPSHQFSCTISQTVDCNKVAQSSQSYLLNLPVPVWCLITYAVFACLGLLGLFTRKDPWRHAPDYALPLALWSVLYSAYLAYVSAFVIKTLCLFCAGLYAVNLFMLIASFFAARPMLGWMGRRLDDLRWLRQDPVRLGMVGFVAVLAGSGLAALVFMPDKSEEIKISECTIDISRDPSLGPFRAPITVVEFSDYQCPACRAMHKTVKELREKYKKEIKIYHKNFPLDSKCNPEVSWEMHPQACVAASAAECAFQMGKYEEYTDMLWVKEDLTTPALITLAGDVGLDRKKFEQCLYSDETKRRVMEDINSGNDCGVQATPTFIINGYKFDGAKNLDWCVNLIEKLKKGETPRHGTFVGVDK